VAPKIVLLPGDGIGPEVTAAAVEVLSRLATFDFAEFPFGAAAIECFGTPLPAEALAECRSADAVLVGAVGTACQQAAPGAPTVGAGLLRLRAELRLYANIRPVRAWPALGGLGPLRADLVTGADFVIVRELAGGLYSGVAERTADHAYDTCVYTAAAIERIAEVAFRLASAPGRHGRVTSVDKANVLETSRLWRETLTSVGEQRFPDIELRHLLVDAAALALISAPRQFDVLVTENMFGDILSDEAAAVTGSLGMLPSASLGDEARGLFEPVHGSAPDISGAGIANPCGAILSAAMLLRQLTGYEREAEAIELAVARALAQGARTPDVGGTATTADVTRAVLAELG